MHAVYEPGFDSGNRTYYARDIGSKGKKERCGVGLPIIAALANLEIRALFARLPPFECLLGTIKFNLFLDETGFSLQILFVVLSSLTLVCNC